MEYISSDTNIWIDFNVIDKVDLPFRLNCVFIMFHEAIEKEVLYPNTLAKRLLCLGLQGVDITVDEYFWADSIADKYPKLSSFDRIALAIAEIRNIVLLTGDMALRKAATQEGVSVIGSLGLLDRMYRESAIDEEELEQCLFRLRQHNGAEIRLPEAEIKKG